MKSNSANLEQFIRNQREAFDCFEPDTQVWSRVEKTLGRLQQADHLEQYIHLNRPFFDTSEVPEAVWNKIGQVLSNSASAAEADPLESFILQHRDSFDAETPDLRVWAAIEQTVPSRPGTVIGMHWTRPLMRVAAAVALLIAGVSIGIWYARSNYASEPGMAMSEVSSEYAELEQYYKRDINAKKEKLATLASYRDEDLNDDLLQMDNVMSELRQELANVPPGNREQVVRAMIENYKAKAAILERVLEHLNQQQPATTNSGNHEVEKI